MECCPKKRGPTTSHAFVHCNPHFSLTHFWHHLGCYLQGYLAGVAVPALVQLRDQFGNNRTSSSPNLLFQVWQNLNRLQNKSFFEEIVGKLYLCKIIYFVFVDWFSLHEDENDFDSDSFFFGKLKDIFVSPQAPYLGTSPNLPTLSQGRFGPSTLDYTDHNNGCGSEIFRAARGWGDVGWLMMIVMLVFQPRTVTVQVGTHLVKSSTWESASWFQLANRKMFDVTLLLQQKVSLCHLFHVLSC